MEPKEAATVDVCRRVHAWNTIAGKSEDAMAPTVKLSATKARQGVMLGRMRYVLAISTFLAVLALIVAFSFA
jgi:hypothetical protein